MKGETLVTNCPKCKAGFTPYFQFKDKLEEAVGQKFACPACGEPSEASSIKGKELKLKK